jgi:SAM-dependent methyltransferase
VLNWFPRGKAILADFLRSALKQVFEPSMVTTERVVEYPFIFQNLDEVRDPILDIGCCSSQLPIALASRGFRVVGIDFNPYPYKHPKFTAVRGDAMRIPFATGCFGAVLAISVIEHIGIGHYGDPLAEMGDCAVVNEIVRVLRPGGRVLITVPFGRAMTDDFQRVYDPQRLRKLLAPIEVVKVEHARSRGGLWIPCPEAEAASVDWKGAARAVALVVGMTPSR